VTDSRTGEWIEFQSNQAEALLTRVRREGATRMLALAVEAEVAT